MSKTAFQEWQYILGQNGVEISTLETGMKTFGTVMDGTSTAGVAAMEALGISFEGMNQEEAFAAAITALQGVEDETLKMSLAADLFGTKAAQNMLPMLNQSAASTEELRQNAHDLGLVLSDEAVNAGVVFGDTLSDLQQSVTAVFTQLGTALMPVLTEIIAMITAYMPQISAMVAQFTPIISELFASLIPTLAEIMETILPVIIELIGQVMPLISEVFTSLLPPLLDVIKALLPPLTEILSAILPVIISLIKSLTPLFQPIINLLTPILNLAISILTPLMSLISNIIPPITSLIQALIPVMETLAGVFGTVAEVLSGAFKDAFEAMSPIIEAFQTILGGLGDFITGVFTGNWSQAWEGIKSIFSGVFDAIASIPKSALNFIISGINTFIRGLNKLKIPDWVPGVGGLGFHINEIPMLASGGNIISSGAAIVGEAGAELVELPQGARVTPLSDNDRAIGGNITQNNYFTQRELSPYETQLQVKRLSRSLAGAF